MTQVVSGLLTAGWLHGLAHILHILRVRVVVVVIAAVAIAVATNVVVVVVADSGWA